MKILRIFIPHVDLRSYHELRSIIIISMYLFLWVMSVADPVEFLLGVVSINSVGFNVYHLL